MTGAFIGSAVVGLLQFVHLRDRRLLPAIAVQLVLASLLSLGLWDGLGSVLPAVLCLGGLVFLVWPRPRAARVA